MSFLYLQGFKPLEIDSITTLYDILRIANPKFVALQLSEKEYQEKYVPIISHPRFPEIMDKIDLLLRIKSPDILQSKDLDLNLFENLYSLDYCKRKKCKILFFGRDSEEKERIYKVCFSNKFSLKNIHLIFSFVNFKKKKARIAST